MLDECAHLGIHVRRVIVGHGEDWGAMSKEEGWDVVGVAGKGGEAILPRGTSDWQLWKSGGRHGWMDDRDLSLFLCPSGWIDDVISLTLSMSSGWMDDRDLFIIYAYLSYVT
jgi:hypothetical protein